MMFQQRDNISRNYFKKKLNRNSRVKSEIFEIRNVQERSHSHQHLSFVVLITVILTGIR